MAFTPVDDSDRDTGVRVVLRARPLNALERSKSADSLCLAIDGDSVECRVAKQEHAGSVRFSFDRVFGPDSEQKDVYEFIGPQAINDVLNGYNATIFAYGQTSSGKTFTMLGPDAELGELEKVGLIPRVVHGLFEGVDRADPNLEFSIKVSYVEIYMETIRDLLEPSSINLQLREDKERGIFIDNARSIYVSSPEEMMEVIAAGAENRELSATGMNAGSSRSHSVLIVSISQRNTENQSTKAGKLFLVDLAGSEMVSKTGAEGQQLEEAKMINKSLTSLGLVIKSLTEGKGAHIPYRDSKLTRMLQESLGGNSRTVLIICVSMSTFNATETLSTVRFGSRAKDIKNKPKVNVLRSMREMETLLDNANKQIARQNKVIGALQNAVNQYRALLKAEGIVDTVAPNDSFLEKLSGPVPSIPMLEDSESSTAIARVPSRKSAGADAVDVNPAILNAIGGTAEMSLRVLELQDEIADLRKKLEDRDEELKTRHDEVLCLSASLLEKEQLLFGAGIHSDDRDQSEAAKVSRDALSRASHNLMLQELEGLKKVYCQVCETHPFSSAKAVSDLIVLHEQWCFEATENRLLVKNLRQKNASLNAEVDALKGYIESGKVEDLLEESTKGKRREMKAELTKLQAQLVDREGEIERLKLALITDDGKSSSSSKKKIKVLEQELEIKVAALREADGNLEKKNALVEDLENQLRSTGDATTVRELNHQLRQMVLVHRQLLRKFAVVDVECSETIMKLQARDQRISELNKQILKLKEDMREQTEWNAMQLEQLRLAQKHKKSEHHAVEEKSRSRLVKPVSRNKAIEVEDEHKSEWDEV